MFHTPVPTPTPVSLVKKSLRAIYRPALRLYFLAYSYFLARPSFYKLNFILYETALHGMGYLNYYSSYISGEKPFMRRLESFYSNNSSSANEKIVIFDVGAHHGSYALDVLESFSRCAIQLHCFEPSPISFAFLQSALTGKQNVILNNIVLANESTASQLYDYHDNPGSEHASLVPQNFANQAAYSSFGVQLSTGDLYLLKHHISKINFLNLDCEGYELKVLQGLSSTISKSQIDFLQFEFNSTLLADRLILADFASLLPDFSLFRLCLMVFSIPLSAMNLLCISIRM